MKIIQGSQLKFLADANVERDVVGVIAALGYDIVWVPGSPLPLDDASLLELAEKEGRILVKRLWRTGLPAKVAVSGGRPVADEGGYWSSEG